jgi:hypothetical protein
MTLGNMHELGVGNPVAFWSTRPRNEHNLHQHVTWITGEAAENHYD